MAEYIDKNIAVKGLCMAHDLDGADFVANIPAADVRENVEGEWIWKPSNYVMCSICGYERKMELSLQRGWIIPKFCEDCGAEMGGAEDG